ncbi:MULTISPECIES: DUF4239 domain-containing protein [Phyllobacterium]|jgi:hypothetical protein|uniref:DUF4239 domain-containing protein n=1 Tax=Phyllobacterium sophorae TaxID=1520277 RepID=A0A2P7BIJ1_9HYPH|nr:MULTISPECIES: DUF4239 domain-containing protein [Phyllobacterium]PSH66285.1 hypothetical protein CU103_06895 [Phyllobacterium sophorae]UXN64151.1 DUF4239 domain-containing protein [Phyllobacterium sp. A18/5-2]
MLFEVFVGAIFVGGTIALTLASYFLMRWITGGEAETHEKDLASSVIFRISALHGLILALVFAQEMIDYQQLRYQTATEANALADIYFDAGRYGDAEKGAIQKELSDYIRVVVDKEWQELGETDRLAPEAWAQWDEAYRAVLDLVPTNPRQQSLRGHMLDRIYVVSDSRTRRESTAADTMSAIFWFAALSGLFFISLAYYSYPPRRRNILLISIFGAYTGIILFLIYAFSNPYSPPAELSPGPLLRLQEQIASAAPPAPS